jgi:SAM-dependent methyltransferase
MRSLLVAAQALVAVWILVETGAACGQETSAPERPQSQSKAQPTRKGRPGRPRSYMGRPIADVMSYRGAEWLVRETREQEEQPESMLDALKIPPGATVADVGAGVGYNTVRLARRVGPRGVVWATDLQPQMLRMLAENARGQQLRNIKLVRATPEDPKLPADAIDLILMVDVYHECSDPEATLKGLRKALKPTGRLVLVEFRAEDPEVPIKPEHKMTFEQVVRELEPQGFVFQERLEFLPWQHIIVFGKAPEQTPAKSDRPRASPTKNDDSLKRD